MQFALSEVHLMIQKAARDFAVDECLPGVVDPLFVRLVHKKHRKTKREIFCQVNYSKFPGYLKNKYGIILKNKIDYINSLILNIYLDENKLKYIDSYDFENLTKRLLEYYGFGVEQTKKTRDGGFDLIATKDDFFPVKYLIECKTTALEKVFGIAAIRSFLYSVNKNGASAGIFVCNSKFSYESVKESLIQKYKLILFDFKKVIKMIRIYVENSLLVNSI